jgi:hypothetical protein
LNVHDLINCNSENVFITILQLPKPQKAVSAF